MMFKTYREQIRSAWVNQALGRRLVSRQSKKNHEQTIKTVTDAK